VQLYFKYESAGKVAENVSAEETSVSKTSGRRATKLLQLRPCKTPVVDALKEHNPVSRIHFYNWFLQSLYDGEVDPQLVVFSSGTWFSLRGEVNYQNSRYWSAGNLEFIHELPLHDEKICVWCATSARRESSTISGKQLQRVNNVLRLYTDCIRSGGQHFQHLL
jgi:hypothetical protein